jgi:UDP-glucose 4-epimerase
VTGGAGFIGSHLVRALLERGDRVRVLDNFSTGKPENLAGLKAEVITGDLRNPQQIMEAVHGVDLIFHLAAFVSVPQSLEDPQTCFEINVQGTLNLFEAARLAGVQRVIVASSAAVYGDSTNLPLKEDEPACPLSPYGASKVVLEVYAGLYTHAFKLPMVALRYFNAYGPRQSAESQYAAVIPIFIHRLKEGLPPIINGDGTVKRDFIFVGDLVQANLVAAVHPAAPGQVFNICTGQETSLLVLLETLGSIFPNAPEPRYKSARPGDIYRSLGDAGRAEKVLGFRATTSLLEGLRQTVQCKS